MSLFILKTLVLVTILTNFHLYCLGQFNSACVAENADALTRLDGLKVSLPRGPLEIAAVVLFLGHLHVGVREEVVAVFGILVL